LYEYHSKIMLDLGAGPSGKEYQWKSFQ